MSLLPGPQIHELLGAAVTAGLHRPTLLKGINPAFVASLPGAPNLAAQLLSDLNELNGVPQLNDQSVPLAQWLGNAISMASDRPEGNVFRRALDALGKKVAPLGSPRPSPKSDPVKILFLGANPSNLTQRALDREAREIGERLRAAKLRERFQLEYGWAVRVSDLQQCLLVHEPTIVHFSGHGTQDGQFMVEDQQGRAFAVNPSALAMLFEILRDNIRCVVLNACASKVQAEAIRQHIDCVVGMTRSITDATAIAFSSAFYQALGFGRSIKVAFDLGCAQILLEGLAEADLPALICREGVRPEEVWLVKASG